MNIMDKVDITKPLELDPSISWEVRILANTIELKQSTDNERGNLGANFKDGGVLLDFGCGDGDLGRILAQRHNMTLVQNDVVDMRREREGSFIQIDRNEPPNYGMALDKTVDNILLVDVLDKVIYKDMDPIASKVALLNRLGRLLTDHGKIMVVADSPAATGDKALDGLRKVQDSISSNSSLKDRVLFYSPNR